MSILGPQRAHPSGRRPALSAARREVLELVVDSVEGLTVADVADATGAHPNTAREHLDALVRSGDVDRAQLPASGRGRPPMIYRALPNAREVGPEYRVLAEALVRQVVDMWPDQEDQRRVGLEAGGRLAATQDDGRRLRLLCAALFDAEVAPDTAAAGDDGDPELTVQVRRCPVLDLAREYPDVVCAVHLGIIRGLIGGEHGAAGVRLEPFIEVGACRLHLLRDVVRTIPELVEALAGSDDCDALGRAADDPTGRAAGADDAADRTSLAGVAGR